MPESTVRLTQYSRGAGCGCKIAPAVLQQILEKLPAVSPDPRLVVGHGTRDDAAVYHLGGGLMLVSTTDFFTPIVDDPFDFGRIAAANALSDVYAMGGKPVMAIAILGWPVETLPPDVASQVMEGGRSACDEIHIPLAGGHSIDSPEPFFGLAVTGTLTRENLKRNDTGRPGDVLILTKPLGTGLISTALKREKASPAAIAAATAAMKRINVCGATLGQMEAVHAMTDVTGFGLAGHLLEMIGTAMDAHITWPALPLLTDALAYASNDIYSDGTMRNFKSYGSQLTLRSKEELYMLCDPQTNGGLLVSVAPDMANKVLETLHELHPEINATVIGRLTEGHGKVVTEG